MGSLVDFFEIIKQHKCDAKKVEQKSITGEIKYRCAGCEQDWILGFREFIKSSDEPDIKIKAMMLSQKGQKRLIESLMLG